MVIEALVNGNLVHPFPFERPENLDDHVTTCGANNYYFNNSTIHFVITNVPTC